MQHPCVRWERVLPLTAVETECEETWVSPDGHRHRVHTRLGKPMDIVSLKADMVNHMTAKVDEWRTTRTAMYSEENLEPVSACPICESPTSEAQKFANVYGAQYVRCRTCEHVYVERRMTVEAVNRFYSQNQAYASTYTDQARAELRVRQVAAPKAEWAIDAFRAARGRSPTRVLDVGAGGGHFVQACRQLGVPCDGVELSEHSRAFSQRHFGIELLDTDFCTSVAEFRGVELITFWGVIEHVPDPLAMVRAARRALGPEGVVVVAVPRWTSLDAFVQLHFSDTLVRHMDPAGHIHLFSDNSTMHCLDKAGFAPVAAWYYGMDAYEWTVQAMMRTSDPQFLGNLRESINPIQHGIDLWRFSDEVAVAACPRR